MLSLLVHGNTHTPVKGLDTIPKDERPPVGLTFHSFHIMIWLGMFFIAITLLANWYRWRKTLYDKRWLLWIFVFAVPLPYVANQLGWMTAEVGRQPWVVYGLLKTSDGISKSVAANQVLSSIILFSLIYALLFFVWLYVLNDKIHHGPDEPMSPLTPDQGPGPLHPGEVVIESAEEGHLPPELHRKK